MTKEDLAKYFDHTNLKPFATDADIRILCEEARKYRFATVCVNSSRVELARMLLVGSNVKVCSVVGFPLGATTTEAKVFETKQAIKEGADEIDMVINVGKLKEGLGWFVQEDIKNVVKAAEGKIVKVIIECCYLTDEEKKRACELAKKAGANFVKTSTGFGTPKEGPNRATIKDVKLMKKAFGGDVKAAGGIKTLKDALAMIEAGATRIGTSASVEIMKEFEVNQNVT
jgi:deoxyribose-phosphate aldolase